MTRKRGLFAICICSALAGAFVVVLAIFPSQSSIIKANFDRTKEGMTLVELEAIFGQPAVNCYHSPNLDGTQANAILGWPAPDGSEARFWFHGDALEQKHWVESTAGFVAKIPRWLNLRR